MPYGNSVIETLRFQWYFIRPNTAEGNITWTLVQISLRSNRTRRKANKTGVVSVRIQPLSSVFFCIKFRNKALRNGASLLNKGVFNPDFLGE